MPASVSSTPLRRLALTATVVVATILLAGCSAISQILPGGQDDVPEGEADVFSLTIGDCLNDAGEEEVMSVEIVACDEPHDFEAYYAEDMEDGEFPGDDAVAEFGDEVCATAFPDFVGVPEDETSLAWTYFSPIADSWSSGDREVLCLAGDTAGQVSQPLEGAGSDFPLE